LTWPTLFSMLFCVVYIAFFWPRWILCSDFSTCVHNLCVEDFNLTQSIRLQFGGMWLHTECKTSTNISKGPSATNCGAKMSQAGKMYIILSITSWDQGYQITMVKFCIQVRPRICR
jgi:hypothetical protein